MCVKEAALDAILSLYMNDTPINGQDKVEEIYRMTKENNEILKSIRNSQRIATFFKVLYWTVILATIGGAYYFVMPLINAFKSGGVDLTNAATMLTGIKAHMPEIKVLEDIMHSLQGATTTP
jgi:hypothetical protein